RFRGNPSVGNPNDVVLNQRPFTAALAHIAEGLHSGSWRKRFRPYVRCASIRGVDTRPTPAASFAASVTSPRQLTLLCALLASGTLAIVTTFLPWISHPTVTGSHALVHNGLLMPTYSTGEGEGDLNIGGGPNGVTTLTAGVLVLALAVLLACTFDRSAP